MWPTDAESLIERQRELARTDPEPWRPPRRCAADRRLLGVFPAWSQRAWGGGRRGVGRGGGHVRGRPARPGGTSWRRGRAVPSRVAGPEDRSAHGRDDAGAVDSAGRAAGRRDGPRSSAGSRVGAAPRCGAGPAHGGHHPSPVARPGRVARRRSRRHQPAPSRRHRGLLLDANSFPGPPAGRASGLAGRSRHRSRGRGQHHRTAPHAGATAPRAAPRPLSPQRWPKVGESASRSSGSWRDPSRRLTHVGPESRCLTCVSPRSTLRTWALMRSIPRARCSRSAG